MQTVKHKPRIGQRVIVIRQSGKRVIARWARAHGAFWRTENSLQWLDDRDRFTDVAFDPVIAWETLNEANMTQHCEICGILLSLPHMKTCRRCRDLRDMLMPLMRNEQAREFLLSQFLSKDDADAIMDMHALTATFGCGPRTNPRRKAWKRLVGLARKLTERKT